MPRPRKYNSGIIWVETPRGNMNPTNFDVTGKGATIKELKEMVQKMISPAKTITIVGDK